MSAGRSVRAGYGAAGTRPSRWLAWLGVDLRPGEGTPALLLFVSLFFLIAFQYTTKSVRQSTFIQSLGAASLPMAYLAVALCSYPVLRLYSLFADRLERHRLIIATGVLIALSMGLFWWLFQFSSPWVPIAFYVWVSIVYVMTVSQFWSFSNLLLDSRQAKRLFGFIGAGGLLGGVVGGQVARFSTGVVGTRYALLVGAVLLLLVAGLIAVSHRLTIHRLGGRGESGEGGSAGLPKLGRARGGFQILRRSRHLRLIAALMVCTVIVAQIVDLQFNWAAERATATQDEATAFFGNFYSVMAIAALVFQLLFTSRIHRLLGVGVAMRVLPATMALGTLALFAAALFPGALVLAAAMVLKIGENGLRYSLDQATRELLYLPVPAAARVKAKAFIDVFVQRGAKGLAAILLLPVTFGLITAVGAGWLSLALIVAWLAVTVALAREYVTSFREGLRHRSIDAADPVDVTDATTLALLVEGLGSTDPRQVLLSVELLAEHRSGRMVPPLLLYHDDPEVRRRTLEVLAQGERRRAVPLVERRLDDDDPDVRAQAIVTLAALEGRDAADLMRWRIHDPSPAVRAAAIAFLGEEGADGAEAPVATALEELICDEDPDVRREAAKALGAVSKPWAAAGILRLLDDPSQRVVRAALVAVERHAARAPFNPLFVPRLVAMLQDRHLKHDARRALVELGEPTVPALTHFMADDDEPVWVRRAIPKTLARIGSPAVGEVIAGVLASATDPFLRRKLIEAVASLPPEARDRLPAQPLGEELDREARGYFRALGACVALGLDGRGRCDPCAIEWVGEGVEPTLLERLLAEEMEEHVANLFGLLAALQPGVDVSTAYRNLVCGDRTLRHRALEYLDTVLDRELKQRVFGVIGDVPVSEKLGDASRRQGPLVVSRVETLRRLATAEGNERISAQAAAALYLIRTERIEELSSVVALVGRTGSDPFVRQTARWVADRLAFEDVSAPGGASASGRLEGSDA